MQGQIRLVQDEGQVGQSKLKVETSWPYLKLD